MLWRTQAFSSSASNEPVQGNLTAIITEKYRLHVTTSAIFHVLFPLFNLKVSPMPPHQAKFTHL